ncbi:MAG: hypothetical protein J6C19_00005 [Lachnospiraceae bacterium]|nr:hypothetical protein [Lachnospiraceae bacterium]
MKANVRFMKKGLAALVTAAMLMSTMPVSAQEPEPTQISTETQEAEQETPETSSSTGEEETLETGSSPTEEETSESGFSTGEEESSEEDFSLEETTEEETTDSETEETTTEEEIITEEETTEEETIEEETTEEEITEEETTEEAVVSEEIIFNTGNAAFHVVTKEDFFERELGDAYFEEDGSYTIHIPEENPFFPYEVQFTYDGTTTNKWFMTPDDCVEIDGHKFYVSADFDGETVTQLSLEIGGKTIVLYPKEKEFTDGDGISALSLQPIQEVILADIDLTAFTPAELTMVKLSSIFAGEQELDSDQKVFWSFEDWSNDDTDFYMAAKGDTINLSWNTTYNSDKYLEIIAGDGSQLDADAVRYRVRMKHAGSREWLIPEIYKEESDDTRSVVEVADFYYYDFLNSSHVSEDEAAVERTLYIYQTYEDAQQNDTFYVGLQVNPSVFPTPVYGSIKVFEGGYTSAEVAVQGNDITDKILCKDVSQKDSGYPIRRYDNNYIAMVTYDTWGNISGCIPINLYFGMRSKAYVGEASLRSEDGQYVTNTGKISSAYGIWQETATLYKEYPANGIYYLRANYYSDHGDTDNEAVTAAFVGQYDSIAAALKEGSTDIKDELFGEKGYAADYSNGVYFTTFIGTDDDAEQQKLVLHFITETGTVSKNGGANLYSGTAVTFTGLRSNDGQEVPSFVPVYDDDSYGEYNYISIFADAGADLTNLAPEFTTSTGVKLYAAGSSIAEESGKSCHDFSKGVVQYTVSSEDGEQSQNYWVRVIRPENGAGSLESLYINSLQDPGSHTEIQDGVITSTREVMIDSLHHNVHDILLANIGTQEIPDLSVELDSETVILDDYWTFSGSHALSGFSTVENDTQFGALPNLGKIRIKRKSSDYSGEITGTLTIKSGSQTLMRLVLTGTVGNPTITTEEIPDAVKYVPYGMMIQNNNKYSWNHTTYELSYGSLPEGMELRSNGELYGVPKENGEFRIGVTMHNSYSSFGSCYKIFTLKVLENTDDNVSNATSEGYELTEKLGNIQSGVSGSYTLVSQGEYDTFVDVYLDGDKLQKGVDYTSEAGSTRITIRSETLETSEKKGKHTLGIEFRDENEELKRAAQNYTVGDSGASDHSSSTNNSSHSTSNSSSSINSSSSSANNASSAGTDANEPGSYTIANEIKDVLDAGREVVNVIYSGNNAILRQELLAKYYGRNVYIMAHLGNGIGYSLDSNDIDAAMTEINISTIKTKISDFAEGFEAFYINPLVKGRLPYPVCLHVNLGSEYVNSPAYIFVKSSETGLYELKNAQFVNEIGNIALSLNEMTEIMVLVAK